MGAPTRRQTLHKWRNIAHSAVLIIGMALIFGACAWSLWGAEGVLWAFVGMVMALVFSPSLPPGLVLQMYRARPLPPAAFPEGRAILRYLADKAALPVVPQLYYLPSTLLNAFAVGGSRSASIALTDGMLRCLTLREINGVLAHEVSHIANKDLWIMNLTDVMSRITAMMSYLGMFLFVMNLPLVVAGMATVPWLLVILLVLAPTIMGLLQLALSRTREFDADLDAAKLTGDPMGLASALAKLERYQGRVWENILLPGQRIPEPSLPRTHPPTDERVRRLMALKEPASAPRVSRPSEFVQLPADFPIVRGAPRWRRFGIWY